MHLSRKDRKRFSRMSFECGTHRVDTHAGEKPAHRLAVARSPCLAIVVAAASWLALSFLTFLYILHTVPDEETAGVENDKSLATA